MITLEKPHFVVKAISAIHIKLKAFCLCTSWKKSSFKNLKNHPLAQKTLKNLKKEEKKKKRKLKIILGIYATVT